MPRSRLILLLVTAGLLASGASLLSFAGAKAGSLDDANALFDRLVGLVNDVGLLSEEYDPGNGRMVGNFPQAFSHLTLVQAAFRLRAATGIVR